MIAPTTVVVLSGEQGVGRPLEGLSLRRDGRELRGDDAGGPVGSFARQRKKVVPKAVGALTFE